MKKKRFVDIIENTQGLIDKSLLLDWDEDSLTFKEKILKIFDKEILHNKVN